MLDRAPGMTSTLALLSLLSLSAATAGCTKSEGPPSGTTSSASAGTTSAPTATVAATASAPDASPTAADTTTGTAPTARATDAAAPAIASAAASGAVPKASASAGGASSALEAANAKCGVKPQPDCPLQAWMKSNTNPAIASNDLPALVTALEKTVSFAPAGYSNWVSIAKDGAKAAKAGDMTATKASCRTCHDQYKAKYKASLRGRKI